MSTFLLRVVISLSKAKKQHESKREEKNYYLSERSYGAFERSFHLPEGVDRDHIKAEVSKGVLTVLLPKTEAAQSNIKKIDVKAAVICSWQGNVF